MEQDQMPDDRALSAVLAASESSGPYVLQCLHCRTIVADTVTYVTSNDELNIVTIQVPSPFVSVSEELQTSSTGLDRGSTYNPILCQTCNQIVGRKYCTTPRALDEIRDASSFDLSKIRTYAVGLGAENAIPRVKADTSTTHEVETLRVFVDALRVKMEKMELLLKTHHARLDKLEGRRSV